MNFYSIWTSNYGTVNVVIYPPKTPCEAFPGSPIFPSSWCAVFFFPGLEPRIKAYSSYEECENNFVTDANALVNRKVASYV